MRANEGRRGQATPTPTPTGWPGPEEMTKKLVGNNGGLTDDAAVSGASLLQEPLQRGTGGTRVRKQRGACHEVPGYRLLLSENSAHSSTGYLSERVEPRDLQQTLAASWWWGPCQAVQTEDETLANARPNAQMHPLPLPPVFSSCTLPSSSSVSRDFNLFFPSYVAVRSSPIRSSTLSAQSTPGPRHAATGYKPTATTTTSCKGDLSAALFHLPYPTPLCRLCSPTKGKKRTSIRPPIARSAIPRHPVSGRAKMRAVLGHALWGPR